jgi:hypothetical protein
VRKIPGTFGNFDGLVTLEQDYDASGATIINTLYVSPRYYVTSGDANAWHLYKIDVGGSVPRQMWHSYLPVTSATP